MSYFNILFNYGVEKFCRQASISGARGLIVPDIPYDEEQHDHYLENCFKYKLSPIQVISPITPIERLKRISKIAVRSKGFVYSVSGFGTTGSNFDFDTKLKKHLGHLKRYIKADIAVGFGIQGRKEIEKIAGKADIAVIGSKIINIYNETKSLKKIREFLKSDILF